MNDPTAKAVADCEWVEIDPDVYQTCVPSYRYFLSQGRELPEFCHHCGKPVVGVDADE